MRAKPASSPRVLAAAKQPRAEPATRLCGATPPRVHNCSRPRRRGPIMRWAGAACEDGRHRYHGESRDRSLRRAWVPAPMSICGNPAPKFPARRAAPPSAVRSRSSSRAEARRASGPVRPLACPAIGGFWSALPTRLGSGGPAAGERPSAADPRRSPNPTKGSEPDAGAARAEVAPTRRFYARPDGA